MSNLDLTRPTSSAREGKIKRHTAADFAAMHKAMTDRVGCNFPQVFEQRVEGLGATILTNLRVAPIAARAVGVKQTCFEAG